ncbi:hypothetical protein A2311_01325 [candidate division WOR-1 bacterium RIFOXYB2_FULL_48_7]|uniref:dolichyl-phosphate beta-glucosyltransferase n=1 Tax=candidate division WOR-1 bacterium RIFOXYB2_FULL_48_7 TaxID=1802583 RepID=A0A1F4TI45_UNCSA|nr:MAG: hypothetical protein A2311_01325 [candidate division WOR-1 bacterium RIFOXYB2_FULL_48_7]
MILSVIIPAYNEAKRLPSTLASVIGYLQATRQEHEIIVVDDGSRDTTAAVARSFPGVKVITYQPNRGKGFAVKQGMLAATGDLRLFMDADNSTRLDEIAGFLPFVQAADIIIGSRAIKGAKIAHHQPFYREWLGRGYNWLVQRLFLPGIQDTQCGFKLFSRRAAEQVFSQQKLEDFSFDLEILLCAKQLGYKIKELPIAWANSPSTKLNPLTDTLAMFAALVKLKFSI